MTLFTKNITENTTQKTLFRNFQKHTKPIRGLIEIGGNFDGGGIEFFISLSEGSVINKWRNLSGSPMFFTEPITFGFDLPFVSKDISKVNLYYEFTGSTSPDVFVTLGDNT